MLKLISTALIATAVLAAAPAMADKCTKDRTAGTYISKNAGQPFIEQLILTSDGTAYWYQGTAFEFFVTGGTYIPAVGAWKCINDTTLVLTVIDQNYHPVSAPNPFTTPPTVPPYVVDEDVDSYTRLTSRLVVQDSNTLVRNFRAAGDFVLTNNPLGTPDVTTTTTVPRTYSRVKVFTSDIP